MPSLVLDEWRMPRKSGPQRQHACRHPAPLCPGRAGLSGVGTKQVPHLPLVLMVNTASNRWGHVAIRPARSHPMPRPWHCVSCRRQRLSICVCWRSYPLYGDFGFYERRPGQRPGGLSVSLPGASDAVYCCGQPPDRGRRAPALCRRSDHPAGASPPTGGAFL